MKSPLDLWWLVISATQRKNYRRKKHRAALAAISRMELELGLREPTETEVLIAQITAIIVRVWSPGLSTSPVQLQVFTDAANDDLDPVIWRTSVIEGEGPNQYRWPRTDQ